MIKLEIANINLLERIKKGQVNFMKKKITAILMVILIGIMAAGCGTAAENRADSGTEKSAEPGYFCDGHLHVCDCIWGRCRKCSFGCNCRD